MIIDSFDFPEPSGKSQKVVTSNIIASPIRKPIITFGDKKFNYMGQSILKNDSEQEQTLSTNSFEKDISSAVSIATSIGI